jgi:hypothetical protein
MTTAQSEITHEDLMELARISCHLTGSSDTRFEKVVNKLIDYTIRAGGIEALESLQPLPIERDDQSVYIYGDRLCFRCLPQKPTSDAFPFNPVFLAT